MSAFIIVALLIALSVLWAFFKFKPAYAKKKQLRIFNKMILGLGSFISVLWYFSVRSYLLKIGSVAYVPLFGIGGAAGLFSVFLFVMLFIRNFWIFRPPVRGGGHF